MVNAWVPILIFFVVAVGFGIVTLLIARLVVPSRYSQVKLDPYECGIEAAGDARDRYSIKYFLVAMLFLIYLTDRLTDEAVSFIHLNRDKPFLLYLAYNAPHFPLQAPAEEIAKFRGKYKAGWGALRDQRINKFATEICVRVNHLDARQGVGCHGGH